MTRPTAVTAVAAGRVRKALHELRDGRADDAAHTLSFLVDWLEIVEEHELAAFDSRSCQTFDTSDIARPDEETPAA